MRLTFEIVASVAIPELLRVGHPHGRSPATGDLCLRRHMFVVIWAEAGVATVSRVALKMPVDPCVLLVERIKIDSRAVPLDQAIGSAYIIWAAASADASSSTISVRQQFLTMDSLPVIAARIHCKAQTVACAATRSIHRVGFCGGLPDPEKIRVLSECFL